MFWNEDLFYHLAAILKNTIYLSQVLDILYTIPSKIDLHLIQESWTIRGSHTGCISIHAIQQPSLKKFSRAQV